MARRPTPIVLQGGRRENPLAGIGQLIAAMIQKGQQQQAFGQGEQLGLTPEESKLVGIEGIKKLTLQDIAGRKEREIQRDEAEQTALDIQAIKVPAGEGREGPVREGRLPLEQQDILGALSRLQTRGAITPEAFTKAIGVTKGVKGEVAGQGIADIINARVGSNVVKATDTIEKVNALFGKIPTSLPSGFQVTVDESGAVTVTQGDLSKLTPKSKSDNEGIVSSSLSTLGLMDDFRTALSPQNVGFLADVTRTVEGAIQQGGAIGGFIGNLRSLAENELNKNEAGILADVTGKNIFDPNLSAMDFLETALTFRVAKLLDPSGRLSDEDFKNAQKSLGFDRALTGEAQIRQRLDAFDKFLVRDLNRARRKLNITFESRLKELRDQKFSQEEAFKILAEERF